MNISNLKQADKELLEHLPVIIALHDRQGDVTWGNRAYREVTGLSQEELEGQKCHSAWGLGTPCSGCPVQVALESGAIAEGELVAGPATARTEASGSWFARVEPMRDEAGQLIGAIEAAWNITDSRLTEKVLRSERDFLEEKEGRYKSLLESMIEGVCLHELVYDESGTAVDYRILEVNSSYERILGLKPEDVAGKLATEAYHLEEAPFLEIYAEVIRTGKPKRFEAYFARDDRYFSIGVFSPEKGRFATIFEDITERNRAGKSLNESRNRLAQIIEGSSIATLVIDHEHRITHWNHACERLTGLSAGMICGSRDHWKAFYPEERPILADLVAEAGKEKEIECLYPGIVSRSSLIDNAYEGEDFFPGLGRNGRWLFFTAAPLIDEDGRIAGAIETLQDITERKEAEAALRIEKAFSDSIIDHSPYPMWVADRQGTVIRVNRALCETLSLKEEQILNKYNVFRDENLEKGGILPRIRAGIERGETVRFNTFWKSTAGGVEFAGGRDLHISAALFPIRTPEAELSHIVCQWNDITEQVQAVEEVQQQRAMLARTEGIAHVGSWEWDIEEDRVSWSRELFNIFGLDPADGAPSFAEQSRIYPPEDMRRLREAAEACSTRGTPYELELQAIRADGQIRYCIDSGRAEKDQDGRIRKLVGFLQDITERKQAAEERINLEAQLQQAQRMESVGRLAGGVAHDFNNMLSVIIGHAEIAMEEIGTSNQLYASILEIHEAAKRSRDITRQLLGFARRQIISPESLDLNRTVADALKMLKSLIGEDIELIWQPGDNTASVRMDRGQIDQIMANLCLNARDAIGGIGRITITTSSEVLDEDYCRKNIECECSPGEYVMLSVRDDGSGMDKETLENVFEPFFSTKTPDRGTGLGLATVYGIVKQNQGHIDVHSEIGVGTTFKIYLPPYKGTSSGSGSPEQSDNLSGHGETVMLVEDEPAIRKMGRVMLEKLGYQVMEAATPQDALRLAAEHSSSIQLTITDVVMPGMNGRDLAEKLQDLYPDIKIMFMSGYTADVMAHHGVLDEGMNFIQKPFSMKDLSLKVKAVLGRN